KLFIFLPNYYFIATFFMYSLRTVNSMTQRPAHHEVLTQLSPQSTYTRSTTRQTVKVTLWVKQSVKAELERRAKMERLSISKVGGSLLEEAIRQSIHAQYATLMQPIIETTIRKQMRLLVTRLTWLNVRIAYDAGQTRTLVTNI